MNEILTFEPHKWHSCKDHDWADCTDGVNCYSYILNNPNFYWSVPGLGFAHAKGQRYVDSFNRYFQDVSLKEFQQVLIEGAVKDGLVKIEKPQDREGYYLSALFFSKDDHDFHWYRKDDNGFWSSKDGWREAKNKDKSDSLIIDPVKDANTLYPILGGYFLVPRVEIILKENFPLHPE